MTTPANPLQPIILAGQYARLEPLSLDHLDQLCAVGLDEDLWRWATTQIRTPDEMREYLEVALQSQAQGTALPFVTIEQASGQVTGSTRYANFEPRDRRVEIGWTWVARPWQRTAINTEAKYLMLRHAFETIGCIRVELKTDALNEQSRRAILRIGAKEEGLLRNHMITASGRYRDTVYFSVIESEWPAVKTDLEAKLSRQAA